MVGGFNINPNGRCDPVNITIARAFLDIVLGAVGIPSVARCYLLVLTFANNQHNYKRRAFG
jgi:hypothetical protein